MDNIPHNYELHHFIETASNDTLQNFVRQVEENQADNIDLIADLKRILEEKYDMMLIAIR